MSSFLKSTSSGFVDLATANLRVAGLCIANMSGLSTDQNASFDSLLSRAHRGDLAFLEYSILHWLHHVESLPHMDTAMTPESRHILKLSLEILRSERHGGSSPAGYDISLEGEGSSERSPWRFIALALDAQNDSLSIGRCPQTLEQMNLECPRQSFLGSSDMDTDADTQSLPTSSGNPEDFKRDETPDQLSAVLVKLAACRRVIETAIDQPRANQGLLLSAYGARPFKCPVVACRRFHYGFSRSKERDSHVKSHDRFKCEEMRCDYRLLGFSSKGALTLHKSLCHGNGFDQIIFPNIQSQSIWESLEIAIDKGDCLVVKQLCIEAMSVPERPKGFVLRALQKKSFAAAHIIIEHLGSAEELRFRDKKGVVDALSCSAGYGDLDLFRKIMPYFEDVVEPFINSAEIAAKEGHEEIVLIVLDKHYTGILASKLQNIMIAALKSGHEIIVALVLHYGNKSVGNRVLFSAIQYGRRSSVKQLLQRNGVPKGTKWNDVRSVLLENLDSAVELCLKTKTKKKQELGDVLADGSTVGDALQAAAAAGNSTELKEILGRGADINNVCDRGTAIVVAAERNHKEIVQLLIDHGADINPRGEGGDSALLMASRFGYTEIVELLLDHGAKADIQDRRGSRALSAASKRGHKGVVDLLPSHEADVNTQSDRGNALQAASSLGHKEIVELLLTYGADINSVGGLCGSALQAASSSGHREIVKLLLDHGADVNVRAGQDGGALQAASGEGHREIVKLLLEHGADVDIRGGQYGSALQAASAWGHKEIVELLLGHGANVNTRGGLSGSALQAASVLGYREIVELLLNHGADVDIGGGQFGSALQAAIIRGHKEVVELLLEHGADNDTHDGVWGNIS